MAHDNRDDEFIIRGSERRDEEYAPRENSRYINYDDEPGRGAGGGARTIFIAVGVGALVAGLGMYLMTKSSGDKQVNIADIPTFAPAAMPLKTAPGGQGSDIVAPGQTIYGGQAVIEQQPPMRSPLLPRPEQMQPQPQPQAPQPPTPTPRTAPAQAPRPTVAPRPTAAQKPAPVRTVGAAPVKKIDANAPKTTGAARVVPVAPTTKGDWMVQIAAAGNRENLETSYQDMVRKHSGLLVGRPFAITEAPGGERQMFRLRLTGFATRDDAAAFCDRLKAYNIQCFTAR